MDILIPIVIIAGFVGFIFWRKKSKKKATGSGGSSGGTGGGSTKPRNQLK